MPPLPRTAPSLILLHTLLAAILLAFAAPAAAVPVPDGFILVPEGGRLDALDEDGQLIGPCPLRHTEVDVKISGHFTRVDVAQRYHNPYDHKIEAVYTFPLSHRGAVDRMTMTVGDRVVEGEVKRRDHARRIYEAARRQGHVASLLEQERPNIFTQSVANIEPGAEVLIEISYVEVLESADGEYRFDFPMVVAPRYTPGRPSPGEDLPDGAEPRDGVILAGPAQIDGAPGLSETWLRQHAAAIRPDSPILQADRRTGRRPTFTFNATYADGLVERGAIFGDGVGRIGDRWFALPPRNLPAPGEPFAPDTDQVPDASRVTPMPVRPDQRAGHDIALRLTIDTGGPGIADLASTSHDITRDDAPADRQDPHAPGPRRTTIELEAGRDIPNRDFRLAWRLTADQIQEATFTHTSAPGTHGDFAGGFFTLILQPPDRIPDHQVRPRELIFVLDQSGSMSGARLADRSALDAAKDVISRTIDTMRENDRFNIISFNNTLDVLWNDPMPNTPENRARAQRYIDQRQGGGGTEMRNAVLRALGAGPFARNRPQPDHDDEHPMRIVLFVTDGLVTNDAAIIQAIRHHAHETRVFTIGMSHAPNRHLLDEMARVGRGAVDYVLPEDSPVPIVERFARRIATPVLTDIELAFEGEATVTDLLPSPEHMPDLFDVQPLVIHGRYADPGHTTLTIRGRTGQGAYERAIDLDLPEARAEHDVIATLWARHRVAELMRERDDDAIVALGESFGIVTQHTSFVAVEHQRVTIAGEPVLVRVPIEFPKGMSWEGIFGGADDADVAEARLDFFRAPADEQAERAVRMQRRADPAAAARPQFDLSQQTRGGAQQNQFGRGGSGYAGAMGGPGASYADDAARVRRLSVRGTAPADDAGAMQRTGGRALTESVSPREVEHRREPLMRQQARQAPRQIENAGFRLVTHVADLPDGTTIVSIALLGADRHDAADHLRDLLESEGEAQGAGAEPLGRVLSDPRTDNLHLIAPAPLADAIAPFAEKLADPDLPDDARRAVLHDLIEALGDNLPDARHDLHLRRVLDDSLYQHVLATRDPDHPRPRWWRGIEAPDPIRVTVLLHDLEPRTLAALRAAGFTPEAAADTRSFTVGRIDAAKLEALATLTPVRRIELGQQTSAELDSPADERDGLLLRGRIERDRGYLLGEPVLVRLEVVNVGVDAVTVPFERHHPHQTLSLSAVFPDGERWGALGVTHDYEGPRPVELQPQESRHELYNLFDEFPIVQPGVYHLRASFETDGRWRRRVPGALLEGDGGSGALHINLDSVEVVHPEAQEDVAALEAVTPREGRGPFTPPDVRYPHHGALSLTRNRRLLINEHPDSYYTGYARYYKAEDALRGAGDWNVSEPAARRALGLLDPIDRGQYPRLFQELVLHRLILAHVGAGSEPEALRPLVREFRERFPDSPYELPEAAREREP